MKLQVIVNDKLFKEIEDVCQMYGFDRSEYIRQAMRESIWTKNLVIDVADGEIKKTTPITTTEAHGKDLTKLKELVKKTEEKFAVKHAVIPKKGVFKYNGLNYVCAHGVVEGHCPEGCVR